MLLLLVRSLAFVAAGHASFALALAGPLPKPPIAVQKPFIMTKHGDQRTDPYFWLKERENPAVRAHLEAENRYADAVMADAKGFEKQLFSEFSSRIEKIDETAPYPYAGHSYYRRTLAKQNYPAYYRRSLSQPGKEELLLDINVLAKGESFFDAQSPVTSPDDRYLAYAFDRQGRRFYTIKVIDRLSRQPVITIEQTTGYFVWAEDSKTILFSRQDPETLRSYQVLRRSLDSPTESLIYEEKDTTYAVSVEKSLSHRYLFIHASSTMADEWLYIPAGDPAASPRLFQARERGTEYSIEDGGDRFYILTNKDAPNFQVMESSPDKTEKSAWKTVLAADPKIYRTRLEVFRSSLVINERSEGRDTIRILDRSTLQPRLIAFPEAVYVASGYVNADYDTDAYLYHYQSLATPPSVYAYTMSKGEQTLVHRKQIPGGFDASRYTTERVMVKARDGVEVPMSIIYRKGLKKDARNPALIYGYGSYGITVEPRFNASRISLLDRGFVFAIAHIRGGSMLGRPWYEDGKLLKKINTFNDFVDCSQYLVDQKFTRPQQLYAMGGSAGGLLMGAVINQRPELYHGIIAQVPFVDVVTSMLDDSIPLTTGEYDEWGNPNVKQFYDYMKSYSPYDNLKERSYPHLLVTTGFHDSQVQYWEPAKWVARMRDLNRGPNFILLRTNMSSGHGGASGRLEALHELARNWSFILKLESAKPNL